MAIDDDSKIQEKLARYTDLIIGAIAGGLISLFYMLSSILFKDVAPSVIVVLAEIILSLYCFYLIINKRLGFYSEDWLFIALIILIAFAFFPFILPIVLGPLLPF